MALNATNVANALIETLNKLSNVRQPISPIAFSCVALAPGRGGSLLLSPSGLSLQTLFVILSAVSAVSVLREFDDRPA